MESLQRIARMGVSVLGLALGLAFFPGPDPAAADILWAVVRYDASLAAGKNVESVTRTSPGSYVVEFTKRDVIGCAYVGTLGGSAPFEFPPAGLVSVLPHPNPRSVWVLTMNLSGHYSDRPFHLKVFC
jgi:hypothetical protein